MSRLETDKRETDALEAWLLVWAARGHVPGPTVSRCPKLLLPVLSFNVAPVEMLRSFTQYATDSFSEALQVAESAAQQLGRALSSPQHFSMFTPAYSFAHCAPKTSSS